MKTKHVFNLTLLCSALVLSGCGGGGSGDNKTSSGTKLEPYLETSMARATTQTFILEGENKHVPFNNNFFYDTDTQSLKFPSDGNDDISNPRAALSYAGGFSTTMPIYIEFSGVGFGDSAKSTLLGEISPDAAKLVKTEEDGTFKLLESGRDFFVATQGNRVSIIPLKPLDDSSNYLVVVTDELRDKNDQPVGISRSYARLKSNKRSYKGGTLETAQNAIKRQEQLADHSGIDTTKIVYSALFTTAPVGKVLTKTATLLAGDRKDWASVWNGSNAPDGDDLKDAYSFKFDPNPDFTESIKKAFDTDSLNFYLDGLVSAEPLISDRDGAKQYLNTTIEVTTGKVKLPYFLENTYPSFSSVPFEPAVAKGKAVTDYPKIKSLQDVPFVLYAPKDSSKTTGIVIYQHGITTKKETVVSIVPKLVKEGLAVIAIDHPLHGERGIESFVANEDHPDVYLNLGALPVARDNMRQSVLDIIGLRIALRDLEATDQLALALNSKNNKVKFLGHSMGGIVGIPAVSIAQNLDLEFQSAVYSSAGGHIAELLFASESFGPFTKHKLLMEMSPAYKNFAERCGIDSTPDKVCLDNFEAALSPQKKLEIGADLVRFKVAAQTLVDVVDPHSFLMSSSYTDKAKDVATLFIQVKGDEVVPNNGDSASALALTKHFIGTEALASLMTSETVIKGKPDYTGDQVFVRFDDKGTHATLLKPKGDGSDATQFTEMQNLVAYFLSDSPTRAKPINDTTVLE